jgi:GDP-L-fucose synthase
VTYSPFVSLESRIFVAGHRGLVGSAIHRALVRLGYTNILTRTRQELDLRDAEATHDFFEQSRPEFVLLAAAKVGGILANGTYPAEFIRDNLAIQSHVIEASRNAAVRRLLSLSSSCIYPKDAAQPMVESSLLSGRLEATIRPYAVAKIAGIEMCWSYNRQYGTRYLTVVPANLYGPGDNFDPSYGHVVPSLLRKAAEAKQSGASEMVVWGSGTPRREFLYSEDLADACVFLMNLDEARYASLLPEGEAPILNVGTGCEVTIRELAETVARVVGFEGTLRFDASKPDGAARKLMDVSRIHALGWRHRVSLKEGLEQVWEAMQRDAAFSFADAAAR